MTDDDTFLARWSRRKSAAAEAAGSRDEAEPAGAPPEPDAGPHPEAAAPPPAEDVAPPDPADAAEPVDLAALPPVETIGPDTDITAFLRNGVPRALREAALARVWTSDPVISRFVEMADYAWDWNTPGGAPGYGPLDPDVDVAGLVEGIVRGTKAMLASAADAPPADGSPVDAPAPDGSPVNAPAAAVQHERGDAPVARAAATPQSSAAIDPSAAQVSQGLALCDAAKPRSDVAADPAEISVARGRTPAGADETGRSPRRRHGRALPA